MHRALRVFAFALLISTSSWAGTVLVGVDDAVNLDYDYQDIVLTLNAQGLQVNSNGSWRPLSTILNSGDAHGGTGLLSAPFWNQTSEDGSLENIGFCVWGGGVCNEGHALDPTATYLTTDAASSTGSANDVTFSAIGAVSVEIRLRMAVGLNLLGWYSVAVPDQIHWLDTTGTWLGTTSFTPFGDFGLVSENTSLNYTFYSQVSVGGAGDQVSHFAFFSDQAPDLFGSSTTVAPEPATWALTLTAVAGFFWRSAAQRRRR